jgi:hypothetical protein
MNINPILILLLITVGASAVGQDSVQTVLTQPYRFEKEQKFSDGEFTIISLREDGLALLRDKNKYKSGNKTWELILLDTALQELHSVELDIDQRKNIVGYEQTQGFLFLLFKSGDNLKLVLDLISIQILNAEINRFEIKPELVLRLSHFIKVGENFVFGGYVNNEPTVLLYNPSSDNLKVLPGFFQKQTELIDLRPNQNQTFNTILIDRSDRAQQNLIFKTFDAHGLELLEDVVPIDEKYILQTGMSSMLVREDLTVIGTWGSRGAKQSHGFFSVPINPFSEQKITYTAFGELAHYLDLQKPKRAKKIKDRTLDALKQNRIPDFTNFVIPYKIEEHPQGFVLLAEAYTPSNTLNRYPDPYMYGFSPYPFYSPFWGYYPGTYNRLYNPYYFNNRSNFRNSDEIKATQSVLVAFDSEGKPRWDYALELKDLRSQSLDQIADFCMVDNQVYFLYKKESELTVKTITLESEESAVASVKVKLKDEGDEIRSEDKNIGAVRHWYGKSFYVWGQHTIRNKTKREDGSRQVFYINKLVVH